MSRWCQSLQMSRFVQTSHYHLTLFYSVIGKEVHLITNISFCRSDTGKCQHNASIELIGGI